MNTNKAELKDKIDKWFEKNQDNMLEDLRKLIAIRSVKSQEKVGAPYGVESRKVLSLAASMLEDNGFDVYTFEDMIITAQTGPEPLKMGILTHLDIVAEGDGWDSDPYEMVIKDGNIYGRGTMDDKGPSIAAMYALYCVSDIYPDLKHGVQILLGSGEESGCDDIAKYLISHTPPPNVFSPDAEYPVINAEKGRLSPFFRASWEKDLTLPRIVSMVGGNTSNVIPNKAKAVVEGLKIDEVTSYCKDFSDKTGVTISVIEEGELLRIEAVGTAGHAAFPKQGNNAQTALIEMLSVMPFADSKGFGYVKALNRLFPHGDYLGKSFGLAMSDDKIGELTLSFNVINLTEFEISGNFDSRTPACADEVDIKALTAETFEREGFTVTSCVINKSHYTDPQTPFVQTLLDIYEEYTGNPRGCKSMGGQTYVHGIAGGVAFGNVLPGEDNNVHGPNEFISLDNLLTSAKIYTMAIIEVCNS